MLQLMSYSITLVCFGDTASAPFLRRLCGMQELHICDFMRDCRFQSDRRRFHQLERNADLPPDDPINIALRTTLLHRGADVKQAYEMVSFCPPLRGCRLAQAL